MMRISAICRLSKQKLLDCGKPGIRGYTLLELLIVMALIGLMTGIALPRMATLYESFKWAGERDEALLSIAELGYQAYKQGRSFDLSDFPAPEQEQKNIPLHLPGGWRLSTAKPVHYRHNGICDGGTLRLHFKERTVDIVLQSPHCRPEVM